MTTPMGSCFGEYRPDPLDCQSSDCLLTMECSRTTTDRNAPQTLAGWVIHYRSKTYELTTEVHRLQSELSAMKDRRCETCGRWDGSLAHLAHLKDKGECVHLSDDDGESVYIGGLPRFMPADKPGCYSWIPRQTTKDGVTK